MARGLRAAEPGVAGPRTLPGLLFGLAAATVALVFAWFLVTGETALVLGGTAVAAIVILALASDAAAFYLLIFAMLLGPQILVGELTARGIGGRGLTLRLDDFLLLIIGFAWLAKSAVRKELGLFPRTPLNQPIALYVAVAIVATGAGVVAERVRPLVGTLFTLKYIQYFLIYFMAVNFTRDRRQVRNFLVAMLATCVAASIVSLVTTPPGQRLSAPFEHAGGEPGTFGGYLVLMVGLTLGLSLTVPRLGWRVALLLLAAFLSVPLLGTLSRASYIAIAPLLLVLLLLTDRKAGFAALLGMVAMLAFLLLPEAAIRRITFTWTQAPERGQLVVGGLRLDTSTSVRLENWQTVLVEDFPKHPLLGHGVTGFRFLDAQYLRVAMELGMVGLFAFVWLQAEVARLAYRVYRRSRDWLLRGLSLGLLAGFVGLVVHSLGANTFIIVRIMEPFWFLMGLVAAAPAVEAAAPPEPAPVARRAGRPGTPAAGRARLPSGAPGPAGRG
jgi:O-antigen ligase